MDESLRRIKSHTAPARHDAAGVCRNVCHGHALDGDVRRRSICVLTSIRASNMGIVGRRPVSAVYIDSFAKVAADALK